LPKKTFECAKHAGADLIIQIKNNQQSLYNQTAHGCKISRPLARHEDDWEKSHGRLEKRIYEVFDPKVFLQKWPEWSEIKRIISVRRFRQPTHSSKQMEPRTFYYASNACLEAGVFAQAIRKHWWCENKNHYIRDTAFAEDDMTKRVEPFNFCVLLSISMNILRTNNCNNIRGTLIENAMDFNKPLNYIDIFVG
jgi:predicted transposase YbfD/YdcC